MSRTAAEIEAPPAGMAKPPSLVGPAFVWLAIQLGAIALSASRVPFSATKRFPQPGELLAVWVMLFVQVTFSALLFPLLMRTFTTAVMTIVSALPFMIVAGFLAGEWDRFQMAAMCGYVAAWLVGLGLWRSVLRSSRAQGTGVALAVLAVLGGPLAWYLRGEFRLQSDAFAWGEVSTWGPYFGAVHVATVARLAPRPWMLMGAHLAIAGVAAVVSLLVRRRKRA